MVGEHAVKDELENVKIIDNSQDEGRKGTPSVYEMTKFSCRKDTGINTINSSWPLKSARQKNFAEMENAPENLCKIQMSKNIRWSTELDDDDNKVMNDIIFFKYSPAGDLGHARIKAVSSKMHDRGLRKGMFLIMVGYKNVAFSDYDQQIECIKYYQDYRNLFQSKDFLLQFSAASPFNYWLPNTPRNVGIKVEIRNILMIDTVRQSFDCRFFMWYAWQPSRKELIDYTEHKKWNKTNWRPRFEFPNAQETKLLKHEKLCIFDEDMCTRSKEGSENYILIKQGWSGPKGFTEIMKVDYLFVGCVEVNATFAEVMELENFPFDTQDLTISLWSKAKIAEMQIIPYSDFYVKIHEFIFLSRSFCSTASNNSEWDFRDPITEIESNLFSSAHIINKVVRRPNVFFWRMMLPVTLICIGALCSFCLGVSDGGDRMAYCFTAVLTGVVYQTMIYGQLPNITYMTFLDWYIFGLFLWMLGIVMETCIFIVFCEHADEDWQDYYRSIDKIMGWVFLTFFVFFQLLFIFKAKQAMLWEAKKLKLGRPKTKPWIKIGAWQGTHYEKCKKSITQFMEGGWHDLYTKIEKTNHKHANLELSGWASL